MLQVDHRIPKSKGRSDEIHNLVTSCIDCNSGKRDLLLQEFSLAALPSSQAVLGRKVGPLGCGFAVSTLHPALRLALPTTAAERSQLFYFFLHTPMHRPTSSPWLVTPAPFLVYAETREPADQVARRRLTRSYLSLWRLALRDPAKGK